MAVDASAAVRQLLIDDAAVSALVSNRVRPQKAHEQDAGKNRIVTHTISGPRTHHLLGSSLLNKAIIQVDGFANSEQESVDLKDAVRKELDGRVRSSVTVGGQGTLVVSIQLRDERDALVQSLDGTDDGVYGFQMDFLVMHQEAA